MLHATVKICRTVNLHIINLSVLLYLMLRSKECFISLITQQEFYCEIELKHLLPSFFCFLNILFSFCSMYQALHGVTGNEQKNESIHTKSWIVNRRRREKNKKKSSSYNWFKPVKTKIGVWDYVTASSS